MPQRFHHGTPTTDANHAKQTAAAASATLTAMAKKVNRLGPCVDCGTQATPAAPLSKRELCALCSLDRAMTAAVEMHQKSGPAWRKHRLTVGGQPEHRRRDRAGRFLPEGDT